MRIYFDLLCNRFKLVSFDLNVVENEIRNIVMLAVDSFHNFTMELLNSKPK